MTHTTEPWFTEKHFRSDFFGIKSNSTDWFIAEEILQKDAERIVGCVNAFVGIDDPEEYIAGVKLLEKEYHSMKERWGLAAVQNRHLVEALRQIKELLTGKPSEENAAEAMLIADSAIQKTKGE